MVAEDILRRPSKYKPTQDDIDSDPWLNEPAADIRQQRPVDTAMEIINKNRAMRGMTGVGRSREVAVLIAIGAMAEDSETP